MKNRIICFMLSALLCAAMLLPELGPAAASGPETSVQSGVDENLAAGIEFTTAPVFSLEGGAGLYGNYSFVSYYTGSCHYIYDQNGKAITNTMFQSLQAISDRLLWAKPLGAAGYAIYRDKKPLTNPIYTDFDVQCGCVIAIRDGGRDFFDLDGNRRTVGTLPSGYEARYVTPAGTVVARIRNTSITSSSGDLFYNYSLLDRNGKVLVTAALVGRNEEDTITATNLENELKIGGALYDCNGHLICPGHKMTLNENRYVGVLRTSAYGEAEKYTCKLYDRTGALVKELDADNVETVCGDVLVFQKNGRYGLMDQNGTVLVPASYSEYRVGKNSLFTPKTRRVALGGFGAYSIYNDQGNFVAELEGYYGLALYPDSILADTASGEYHLYDLNGTLMKEYQNGEEFKYNNGIWFQRAGSSNSWYVVDLCGNRLSEMNFSRIGDGYDFDLYGIARAYQNGWYMVNAAGELLNAEKMDQVPKLYGDNVYHANTEKYLGVYVQNGKAGIFRYVPPIGACEKTEDGKHDWQLAAVITPATCVEGGFGTYRCAACGRTKDRETPADANAHAWTLTEILTEAEEGGLHACVGLYTCTRCNETKEAPLCAAEVFTDMPAEGNWAHDPIDWAYFHGITSGKTPTTFAPKDTVTRAEAMTFLWKTVGSPEPEAEENPFTDVPEGKYFYKPVLWAVENDVTGGATETTFAPKQKCTRAQIMMFLWAAAGRPEPETDENPFTDVAENKYYYSAVLWAVENGVTGGIAPDKFGPNNTCTRAQIVTFLYKAESLLLEDPLPDPEPDPEPDPDPTPDPETDPTPEPEPDPDPTEPTPETP